MKIVAFDDGLPTWKQYFLSDLAREHEVIRVPFEAKELPKHDKVLWIRSYVKEPAAWINMAKLVGLHWDGYWGIATNGWENSIGVSRFWDSSEVWTPDPFHPWDVLGINHKHGQTAIGTEELSLGKDLIPDTADIIFIGQENYPHKSWTHRNRLISHLRATWGSWFEVYPWDVRTHHSRIRSAKIVIADGWCTGGEGAAAYRVPQSVGLGAYVLMPAWPGVTDGGMYTEGVHLGCWEMWNWYDLDTQIEWALSNPGPRSAIAIQGKQHTIAHHTMRHRVREMF